MALLGIELNDSLLTAASADGMVFSEPGCALLTDAGVLFGEAAAAASRAQPKAYVDRYWHDLSETPMVSNAANMETLADIAFAHLHALWVEYGDDYSEVALAVPGWWRNEQLSLLLGIAQEAGMPVTALVPAAVAATRCEYPGHDLLHIDLGTHATCVTRVSQDGAAAVGDHEVIASLGTAALDRTCAEYVARRFLECSRFDPLFAAQTEQHIYAHMHEWLALLERNGEAEVFLEHQGNRFSARLSLAELDDWLQRRCQPLIQSLRVQVSSRPTAIQLHASFANYPGIAKALADLPGCDVFLLEAGAAARGLVQRQEHLQRGNGSLGLTVSLPWDKAPASVDVARAMATVEGGVASHVVLGGTAYRFVEQPLRIGSEAVNGDYNLTLDPRHAGVSRQHCSIELAAGRATLNDHSRFGTRLNGHKIEGTAVLQPGDIISIGDPACELQVIGERLPAA